MQNTIIISQVRTQK